MQKAARRGHPHAHVNFKSKIAYWNILKCAHSAIQMFLNSHNYEHVSTSAGVPATFTNFSVIRDPPSRYLSSVHLMWAKDQDYSPERFLEEVLEQNRTGELWTNGGDQHFADQIEFLPSDREMRLFRIEDIDKIPKVLKIKSRKGRTEIPHVRPMASEFREAITALVTSEDKDFIREEYSEDTELYNSIQAGMV